MLVCLGVKYSDVESPQVKPKRAKRVDPAIIRPDPLIALYFTKSGNLSIINFASTSSSGIL